VKIQHRDRFGVKPICRTLGVSTSVYYQRATRERSERSPEDERLTARIREVHEQNFECYGYPQVWHELQRQGEQVGRDHMARLMRQEGIQGAKRRGRPWRTTIADLEAQKRPDLVKRDFTATAPDRLWVGDLTYLRTWEGRMYFAFLIDVFSRMIVGWQIATHMRCDLVLDALRMALGTRQPGADVRLVQHTYQSLGSTQATTTPRSSMTPRCSRRSGRSTTATTTRSPNHSWTPTRPS
jgi:putative transposase